VSSSRAVRGFVKLLRLRHSSGKRVPLPGPPHPLGGPRRQGQKPQEELVVASFFAMLQERFGVIGVVNGLEPLVASGVPGNERVSVGEAESIGISFERERLAGGVGGHGGAVRVQGNAKLPGGADLGHGGNIKRMQRQWAERRPLLGPSGGRCGRGFAVVGTRAGRSNVGAWRSADQEQSRSDSAGTCVWGVDVSCACIS
jgi:hypothetical protein